MICSKPINVKPHAALRNHFIFHNGNVAKIRSSLIAAGDKQEMEQEDKNIRSSCRKRKKV